VFTTLTYDSLPDLAPSGCGFVLEQSAEKAGDFKFCFAWILVGLDGPVKVVYLQCWVSASSGFEVEWNSVPWCPIPRVRNTSLEGADLHRGDVSTMLREQR
jgi:hypothetical protein